MTKDIKKILISNDYKNLLLEVVDNIVLTDNQSEAFKISVILEKAINNNLEELKNHPEFLHFYEDSLLKLKFICLPSISEKEILSIVKNNFCNQFLFPDYKIFKKINLKLLSLEIIKDRNKFKESLKKAILENIEEITAKSEIKTVKDWLNNYIVKVGIESKDKLARAQYMVGLKNNKDISSEELERLKILFSFFDDLNIPSDEPDGLEEEYPMIINGKLHIFRKGILEPINSSRAVEEALKNYVPNERIIGVEDASNDDDDEDRDVLADEKPTTSKKPTTPTTPKKAVTSEALKTSTISETPASPQKINIPRTTELEEILASYSASSLEYKAISQEIMRLKKTEARKNAKR